MTKLYERYHPDLKSLHHKFQTAPCFICEIVRHSSDPSNFIVYEDDRFIAFLDGYPRQIGYTLVCPKQHLVHITADFNLSDYLALQELIYQVCETIRVEMDAERMYILTLGSNQGNAHVHWHVVPLPKGTPYEQQQGAAVGWQAGVLKIPEADMVAMADRLRKRIEEHRSMF